MAAWLRAKIVETGGAFPGERTLSTPDAGGRDIRVRREKFVFESRPRLVLVTADAKTAAFRRVMRFPATAAGGHIVGIDEHGRDRTVKSLTSTTTPSRSSNTHGRGGHRTDGLRLRRDAITKPKPDSSACQPPVARAAVGQTILGWRL